MKKLPKTAEKDTILSADSAFAEAMARQAAFAAYLAKAITRRITVNKFSIQLNTIVMKLPSPMEMQLLALVADDERSGREVAEMYKQETGKNLSFGTLYITFRRLKDEGWVTVRDDHDEDGRVRYFKIDIAGRRALTNGREFYAGVASFGLPGRRTA